MRVALRLGIVAVILIGIVYGILTLVGVFRGDDVSDGSASNSSSQSSGGSTSNDEMRLLPIPLTEASDLLSSMGIRRESGVTLEADIVRDPRDDFEHPLVPRALPNPDFTVDITAWSSLGPIEVNDPDICALNGQDFACGSQPEFFVACGNEARPLSEGPLAIVTGEVISAFPREGDDKSRRISLTLDDGNPANNWTANAGNDNDFRHGFDTFIHVDRPSDSDEWSVTRATVRPDSLVVTGETGVRVVIKDNFFVIIIPETEMPEVVGGIDNISGSIIVESFSGSLPHRIRDFIHDPNVPYSGDRTPRQLMFFNSDVATTCS